MKNNLRLIIILLILYSLGWIINHLMHEDFTHLIMIWFVITINVFWFAGSRNFLMSKKTKTSNN